MKPLKKKDLNKKTDVDYDEENGIIKEIYNLEYEVAKGFSFKRKETKKAKKIETNGDKKINLLSSLKKKTESNRKKRESEKKKIHDHLSNF